MATKESGLRPQRLLFVREDEQGVTPENPEMLLYSNNVASAEFTPDAGVTAQRGIGSAAPQEHRATVEASTGSVEYHQVRTLVDGSGDPSDAAFDAILRDGNNDLANSHTVIHRESHVNEGVNGTGRRIYTVGFGAFADAEMSGDATSDTGANYITISLDYQFEKLRTYQIDQPEDGGETLDVVSSDASDTTQSVVIENDDASTTETISLDGTTVKTTTATFSEIDAIYITDGSGNPSETVGDVTVTGTSSSNDLATLYGSSSYDESEGDEGIPALGTGSKESSISGDYSLFLGSTFEWPAGTDVGERISSFNLSVDNSIEATPDSSSRRQSIDAGNQTPQMTATIFGENETHTKFIDHFQTTTEDLEWTTSKETITLSSATINDPGSRTLSTGEAIMNNDVQFEGTGLSSTQV
jgi:hypothetical protein